MRKRLDFIAGIISARRPRRVLDMGCGTGANLTTALAAGFPDVQFVGADSDEPSIAYAARENVHTNARFVIESEAANLGAYDLVIASEVIEHVEDPDAFLEFLRNCLSPKGNIVLTLPNGYGPFECASLIETVMQLTGLYKALRTVKRALRGAPMRAETADTLAVSPHINFFSYGLICGLLKNHGFTVLEYRPRTFLCGFGFDQLMKSERVLSWNARVADRLPPHLVSAWMFLLEPGGARRRQTYRRSAYAKLRRRLNEKRWETG